MKISNLLLFFYNGGTAVRREQEDSRGWRYHGQVTLEGIARRVRTGRVHIIADSVSAVHGVSRSVALARVLTKAAAQAHSATSAIRSRAGATRTSASSWAAQAPLRGIRPHVQDVSTQAAVGALATTVGRVRTRTGALNVAIGPDLVEQEFEEILLLLEVA